MAIVTVTPALVAQALRETDWDTLDAQTDEDIARNVAGDPDAAPILDAAETAAAIVRTSACAWASPSQPSPPASTSL